MAASQSCNTSMPENFRNIYGNIVSIRKGIALIQERIKGTEKTSPIIPYSIGNSSRVIFRIGIKLPRALRGCFVEVLHD